MKKIIYLSLAVLLIVLISSYFYLQKDFKPTPPTLYLNGHFITLNEAQAEAEAMLVQDGRIQAIGTAKELKVLKKADIQEVDLKGATVMPGFIDPHTHFFLSMLLADMHDLSGFKHASNREVWQYFEEIVQQTAAGEWIICKGIDPLLVQDLVSPSLSYLDSIAPQNPVLMLSQSLHNYWANSLTFEKAGINATTPNPSEHSYYERTTEGKLTGLIVEQEAIEPILGLMEKEVLTAEVLNRAATQVMADYAKYGNTSIVSTGLTINDDKPLILLKHLSDKTSTVMGNLLETLGFLPKRQAYPRHFIYMRHDRTHLLPESPAVNDFYNIIGVKHWMDGSPYIGTMYLESPYLSSELSQNELHIPEGHRGEALIEKNELERFINDFHTKGWQIAIHAQGDTANRAVINAFEKVNKTAPIRDARHRLEHCLLLPVAEMERLKRLQLTPSFHINHLYYYGDALKKDILGEERTAKILPVAAAQRQSIKYSLHADQPMFPSRPFRLIQTAIERKTKSGDTIGEDQKITLLEAIQAMTIHAAWQINMEDKIGSLEVGKDADFIVLDKNPFEIPTERLEDIRCLQTFVHGNLVKWK